jgi:hypothetical protein
MDKLNPKIIAGVVVVLLVVAAVLMYLFIPRASAPAPAQVPSEDDTPLKPLKSATVLATKTGGGGGVSGYSFEREYDVGTCTFTTAMNKYVTLTATLGIDTTDTRLPFVDKVKAIWKTGAVEMSFVEVTLNPPTAPASLVLLIPATTNTAINIACDGSGTARTDNTIQILYYTKSSSGVAPPPKLWGTITMSQGLGTEITSAFDSIPVGKGTELTVTLVAAGVGEVTTTQSIPYKFTVKGTSPPQVINPIYLQVVGTNTYIMTVGTASVTVKTRKKILSSYADYVALQVESGSRPENIGDYISIQPSGTITYKRDPPDDSCFFKIEMASQDCQYTDWTVTTECSKTCGTGTFKETRSIITQPSGGGSACDATQLTRWGATQCNLNPCPIDCVLSATGTQFADVPGATCSATNCVTPGTKQQMKISTQSSGGGKSCETVYNSMTAQAKTPVTTSAPCTRMCTVREVPNSRFTITGTNTEADFLVANGAWPAGVSGSRLEVTGLTDGVARTVTLKVFPSSGSSIYQFPSPPLPSFTATNQATVVKIVLTNTGQLKYSTKASATTGTWSTSTAITPPLSPTQQYSLRIVEYVDSTSTTTKLEIGTVDAAGVFTPKATYPSW